MDKSYKKERGIRIDSCIELLFVLYVFWYILLTYDFKSIH